MLFPKQCQSTHNAMNDFNVVTIESHYALIESLFGEMLAHLDGTVPD